MEDGEIVELYWQRSDQAIAETEQKYGRYCHSIAYSICVNDQDAEECVNDTWLRAWNLMPDKRPGILSVFLGGITRNFALDRWRERNRAKRGGGEVPLALEELSDCVPAASDVERELEMRELEQAVRAFVATLPETERRIFIARYWLLLPVGEIAKKFGYSQSKTKTMLFRLRGKLRQRLQEEGLC